MIETARLLLRPPQAGDRQALHAMWADAEVMRDLGPVKSAADSDATLARHAGYRAQGLGFLSAVRRDDGALVGFCGLKPGAPDTPIADELEAGWSIARAHWRRGYALEAMRAVIAWGWQRFPAPRIVAITAAQNAASRALMERLGMQRLPDGDFVHAVFGPDDPRRNTVTYAVERSR